MQWKLHEEKAIERGGGHGEASLISCMMQMHAVEAASGEG